jgi:LacI family transcriptional regulator
MIQKPKNTRVTGAVIAEHLGITPATVSRALAGNPRISTTMQKKVRDTARELGYISNATARTLVKGHSNTIGILSGGLHVERVAMELIALDAELRKQGFLPLLLYTRSERESIVEGAKKLIERGVDGLVIIGCTSGALDELCYQSLTKLLPTVFVDTPLAGHHVNMIINDYMNAYREAADILIRENRTHVHALVKQNMDIAPPGLHDPRFDGIISILERMNCRNYLHLQSSPGPAVLHDLSGLRQEYINRIEHILKTDPKCDAIVCNDDDLALCILGLLQERQKRVPDDIAILGFSNIQLGNLSTPQLSTIAHQPLLVAKKTIERLLELITRPDSEPVKIYVPGKLVNRQTLHRTPNQ